MKPVRVSKYPVSLVMKDILTSRFNGDFIINSDKSSRSMVFLDGDLVSAESNVFDERIGVLLYLLAKIAEPQYEYINHLSQRSDGEIGTILVENHFISGDDLFYARLFQLRKIAINSLGMDRGQWVLQERKPGFIARPAQRIQLPPVIAEGARKMENLSFFIRKVEFLAIRTSEIPEPIKQLMGADEITLYRRVQDCQNLPNREIISRLNLEPEFYWKKMVLFILLGIVDFKQYRFNYDIGENIHRLIRLQKKLKRGKLGNPEILGINPGASRAELKLAYLKLSRIYHPDRFGSAAAPEIKKIATFVHGEISRAYQALRKEKKKVAAKIDKEPKDEKVRAEDMAEYEAVDLHPEMDDEFQIELEDEMNGEQAAGAESMEDDFMVDFQEDLKKGLEEADRKTSAAPPEAAWQQVEPEFLEIKNETELVLGQEQEIPAETIKPDSPVLTGDKEIVAEDLEFHELNIGDSPIQPQEAEKTPYETADELYKREKYQEAIGVLKAAIKKEPNNGEYFYLLGLCQSHLEFFQVEAERNLRKAIQLNPWSSDPVYALGVLFGIQGKNKPAAKCFERVLTMSKGHSKAVDAMRELGKKNRDKDSLFTLLKKK
jgi:tetratricopeptide (TPR) repeat protein